MAQAVFLVATKQGVGLTSVAVGLVHALDRRGVRVGFCKPIAQQHAADEQAERSTRLVERVSNLTPPTPIALHEAEELFGRGREDELLEEVVARYQEAAKGVDTVIVEGLVATAEQPYATRINADIARSLGARIILVALPDTPAALANTLELAAQPFGGVGHERVLGAILNQVGAPPEGNFLRLDLAEVQQETIQGNTLRIESPVFRTGSFEILGAIPWQREFLSPRVRDVQRFLGADILLEGDQGRRVTDVALGASTMINAAQRLLPGTLFITSGDRDDLLVAAALAALSGVHIAALLLTNGRSPSEAVLEMCREGFATGLPVLLVSQDSFQTALEVREMNLEVPLDDQERIDWIVREVAAHVDSEALEEALRVREVERRLSPPAFRHLLVERAREADKRIVLPEGNEPRTVRAAAICQERGVARCVLLGDPDDIAGVASRQGVTLPEGLEIVEPQSVLGDYIAPMVELRKHKGLIAPAAEEALQDNVVLGTMMLHEGDVDGLVSGAVHTTANTIRPALQLIKTAPGAKIVSSIFFMLLPDGVLVYGDCAVNPDPTAEELADIALQSADSAQAFGIPPRVAMLSYSTGSSGSGSDVEKVKEATRIAQERRPDLLIDGPLQYDAAAIRAVAKSKAPDSRVAGRATVFIFPDLNTGNTTYKAVQRSADVISIGPMLQGLRKPVNDLSRGALVDDIVFTIALTAIQAGVAEAD